MQPSRRICEHPTALGLSPANQKGCPDLWELDTGDFIAIGRDVTDVIDGRPAADLIVNDGERAVLIPRSILVSARKNIPAG